MSLLTRVRGLGRVGSGRTEVGHAVLVHAADGGTAEARALAASLPADPEHDLVVADLPPGAPVEVWESFASALPKGRRPVRLVPGRHPREVGPHVARWLADRLGRAVLAPCGLVHHGVTGSLFVHSGPNSGWVWFPPGRPPEWEAKRFPRPAWESPAFAEPRKVGAGTVAEPLPAGVWLRPDDADDSFAVGRAGLTRTLPCRPDALVVVLGSPGAADLDPAEVAAFCHGLPPEVLATAWFVPYGGVALPPGAVPGQALADLLGAEVRCSTGLPVASPDGTEVHALRPDGTLGRTTIAQGFAHRPRGGAAEPPPPRLCAYQPPVAGLGEMAPGVYWYAPDTVIEVVAAGLWVRPADTTATAAAARTAPLDPDRNLVLYEALDPAHADRLRVLAQSLLERFDHATLLTTALMPTTALPTPPRPRAEPLEPTAGAAPADPAQAGRPVSRPAAESPAGQGEAAETSLPLLSRMMETVTTRIPGSGHPRGSGDDRSR
ncbi:hypothetical protein AB0I60_23065 [Actinosynnema sp. NPDC050436]|uniref:hypothetical protein n=1 Tax=Actinosynnema sp. NPDC050436 TaxID=3155659 RepID=UPI0033CF2A61